MVAAGRARRPPEIARAIDELSERWARCASQDQVRWLREAVPRSGSPYRRSDVLAAYAAASRRVAGLLAAPGKEPSALSAAGLTGASGWPAPRVARALLLCAAGEALPAGEAVELVAEAFRTGDNAEREALLGALILLPEPELFLATALEACRTNVLTVFEAIACENPYPARHFPRDAFNQMVLKALFLGTAITRIVAIEERANPELARMAASYASERRAAGRFVPEDIALVERLCEAERVRP